MGYIWLLYGLGTLVALIHNTPEIVKCGERILSKVKLESSADEVVAGFIKIMLFFSVSMLICLMWFIFWPIDIYSHIKKKKNMAE